MADRLKQKLDADWHTFLDHLNDTYENAYQSLLRQAPKLGDVESIELVEVHWPVNESIHIGLGAIVRQKPDANET